MAVAAETNRSGWLQELRSGSTLADLPGFYETVTVHDRGRTMLDLFDRDAALPGVIVHSDDATLTIVSRNRFLEQLSQPFGHELYLNRPIGVLLQALDVAPLTLPTTLDIQSAAQAALSRPTDIVFEPILVINGRLPELVDTHTLLRAQSRLLELANDTIREQMQAAERANTAKSRFLANMSHEIRTPLTAIIGFAEMLLEPQANDADQRQSVGTILRNGQHLLQVINDILDLAKIEAGKIEVERLPVSPAELAAEVLNVLRIRSEAKNIALTGRAASRLPQTVLSDPTRLRQILMNLVGNAIKFTETGSVELVVRMEDARSSIREGAPCRLRFDVIDTGIGMTPAQLGNLFQPFVQADSSTTRRFGGTGLGLSVSRHLANLLGGEITVSSESGRGSVFHFEMPSTVASPADFVEPGPLRPRVHAEAEQSAPLPPCRLLVAEDSPDNQVLLRRFLSSLGARVEIVENGQLAVDAALRARDAGAAYDIILMDMQMPVLDGYSAVRALRERGYTGSIVALTANAMSDDCAACLASGCNDYATKPIQRRRLADQLRRLLSASTESPMVSPSGEDESGTETSSDAAVYDERQALQRCGHDRQLLAEIVDIFHSTWQALLQDLQAAAEAGDRSAARRLAHTIKGTCDTLGGRPAVAVAAMIESAAKDGDEWATLVPALNHELQRLAQALPAATLNEAVQVQR